MTATTPGDSKPTDLSASAIDPNWRRRPRPQLWRSPNGTSRSRISIRLTREEHVKAIEAARLAGGKRELAEFIRVAIRLHTSRVLRERR